MTASASPIDFGGEIVTSKGSGALWVELRNPAKRNALTWRMYDQLEQLAGDVDGDDTIRAVVIRGAGGGAFAAGTDIRQFTDFTGEDGVDYEHRVARVLEGLAGIPVPVVAVVEGAAVGGGLALAALSDIVIATPDAVFGAPIARTLGNALPAAVVARLQSRLGASRTMAMLLTSSLVAAEEAALCGFVHEVVERESLDQYVDRLVRRIVGSAPLTLRALKEVDRRLTDRGQNAVDADDVLLFCYSSADFREGVTAFLEHRSPEWKGR